MTQGRADYGQAGLRVSGHWSGWEPSLLGDSAELARAGPPPV